MSDDDDILRIEERIKQTRSWVETLDEAIRGGSGSPGLVSRVNAIEVLLAPSNGQPSLPVRLDRLERALAGVRALSWLVLSAVVINFIDRVTGIADRVIP